MGIALLLLLRTFASKPKRTLLFLLGYALATAVMVTLLAVGEAVLQQARDKDLLGGGDLVLVPQGIDLESMKVGGISALYYSIPQARFILRQILNSSRFEKEIQTVSPYIVPKVVYIRRAFTKKTAPLTAFAEGSLPGQENALKTPALPWKNNIEDDEWFRPRADNFYHDIDHFHLPQTDSADLKRWAEWHYFNFESPSFYGYLSLMVQGNILKNEAEWIVSLQIFDQRYNHYSATYPATRESLPLKIVDYHVGPNQVRFNQDHYDIDLNLFDRIPIRGTLRYFPAPGLYFPPTLLANQQNFESGYVIPAIRGRFEGSIQVGNKTYDFDGINGYHDHNWGIWRQISWNWGHAFSKEFAIFFGEIYVNDHSKGLFAGVYDSKGFVTLIRPQQIKFSQYENGVPQKMQMKGEKRFTAMNLAGRSKTFVTTPLEDSPLKFVQYNMDYDVQLLIDGKEYEFDATGNAETFVSLPR